MGRRSGGHGQPSASALEGRKVGQRGGGTPQRAAPAAEAANNGLYNLIYLDFLEPMKADWEDEPSASRNQLATWVSGRLQASKIKLQNFGSVRRPGSLRQREEGWRFWFQPVLTATGTKGSSKLLLLSLEELRCYRLTLLQTPP